MLNNAVIPTAEQLAPLIDEATSKQTQADFVTGYVKNLANILTQKPANYRAYGMYWWAIKELLNARGYSQFGDTLEVGTLNVFNYEDKALLCAAAWAYHAYNMDNGAAFSSTHLVAMVDDEDSVYYLEDLEMESLILG